MGDRLIQTLDTGTVAAGDSVVLTHDLNRNGSALKPDFVWRSNGNFEVIGSTTSTITVRNNGAGPDSCSVCVERKHTIPRVLDSDPLTPAPFVQAVGGAGGAGALVGGALYYEPDVGAPVHIETRYLRPAGNNNNDGLTPATAWAGDLDGLHKALEWLQATGYGLCQRLNVTGCTFADASELMLGGGNIGGGTTEIDFAATGPNNFFTYTPFQILAEPTLDLAVTVTLTAQDANSKLWTVTVAEAMVVNAHVGKNLLCDPGFTWGTIKSNGVNTLLVATSSNPATWVGQVGIYSRSASFTFGDPAGFAGSAISFTAYAPWTFVGIDFKVTPGCPFNSINGTVHSTSFFQMCAFEGFQLLGGSHETYMDACYVHDGSTFTVDAGACVVFREGVMDNVTPLCHGTDHSRFFASWFSNLTLPLGSGSLSISQFPFDVVQCQFDSCAAGALIFLCDNCRLQHAKIENTAGPIVAKYPSVRLEIINVGGTAGNTGTAGLVLETGAQADVGASVTVDAGAGLERKVGGNAVGLWATLPETDVGAAAPQFCRVY